MRGAALDYAYSDIVFNGGARQIGEQSPEGALFVNTGYGVGDVGHVMRLGESVGSTTASWIAFAIAIDGAAPQYSVALSYDEMIYQPGALATDHVGAPNPSRRVAECVVRPGRLDFGSRTTVATWTPTQPLLLENVGGAPLRFLSPRVEIIGPHRTDFNYARAVTPELAPGESSEAAITVAFNPSEDGLREATLRITTNSPTSPTILVPLVGLGTPHGLNITPGALDFGAVGKTAAGTTRGLLVENFLENSLRFSAITITGDGYSLEGDLSYELLGGFPREWVVIFNPTQAGGYGPALGNLRVESNDATLPEINISLSATVVEKPIAAWFLVQ